VVIESSNSQGNVYTGTTGEFDPLLSNIPVDFEGKLVLFIPETIIVKDNL
jgi:hypothetical protein